MTHYKPTALQQNQFIWKDPLPCVVEFGYELRRMGLSHVVDLGCRVGGNTIALSEIGLNVTALDSSEESLRIVEGRAYQKQLTIKTIHHTLENLPFENNSVHAFVTATAIHHSKPSESKKLVDEIYRALIPGGRVLIAVLSINDYRYGTGTKIDENTFADTTGPEIRNTHQFFTEETLLSLFSDFTPECTPMVVPSTFVLHTENEKKQGKLLVGKFIKGGNIREELENLSLFEKLIHAKRSVELLFSYPNHNGNNFSTSCIKFFETIALDGMSDIYCQCVVVGNQPIDTVAIFEDLQKLENNDHFSLAYSEQTNESNSLNIAIIDGVAVYCSTNPESSSGVLIDDCNPKYINYFRQQLLSYWKKATIMLDNGRRIKSNIKSELNKNTNEDRAESKIGLLNFKGRRKSHIKVGVTQISLDDILAVDEDQLFKPDLMQLPNAIELVLLKAANLNLDLLLLPELSGDETLNTKLQNVANEHNMVIIGGSYYDSRRINCCPVAIPGQTKPYIVEKIHPSPLEISPNIGAGIVNGSRIIVFQNTVAGNFGVLICADFLNDALVEEVCSKDIDFLCVISMNNDSPRFFEKMNLKCENYQRGIYILYSNCLFSTDGFKTDGMSSIFGFMDRLYLAKLKCGEVKYTYQITSFYNGNDEGLLVADININERRPTIGGVDRKPNVSNINKIIFE